jgi:hypothetical protein
MSANFVEEIVTKSRWILWKWRKCGGRVAPKGLCLPERMGRQRRRRRPWKRRGNEPGTRL